jgi:hypothetical protein
MGTETMKVPSMVGKRVVQVRPMTAGEKTGMGWFGRDAGTVLVFDDGTMALVSQDPEGNGPGCLFLQDKGGAGGMVVGGEVMGM